MQKNKMDLGYGKSAESTGSKITNKTDNGESLNGPHKNVFSYRNSQVFFIISSGALNSAIRKKKTWLSCQDYKFFENKKKKKRGFFFQTLVSSFT